MPEDNGGLTPPNVDMDRYGAIGPFRICAGLMLRLHEGESRYHSRQENRGVECQATQT